MSDEPLQFVDLGPRDSSLGFDSVAPRPNAARLKADLERLRDYTLPQSPYTRRAFSPVYLEARSWLRRRMAEAALEAGFDAAGNLVGARAGRGGARQQVLMGSHIDTVPGGGLYDGMVGVVAALEVARLIEEAHVELPFGFQVVDFLCEEPSDFGLSCIGSQGMVGTITPDDLRRKDSEGRVLADVIREAGGEPGALTRPLRGQGEVAAYLELHIEQGPVLESAGCPIGVVTGIAGIRRFGVTFGGRAGHAGTIPMAERKDALVAAAEVVLEVERLARRLADDGYFVATAGSLTVSPGAANVVPGGARLAVEARALTEQRLETFAAQMDEALERVEARREVEVARFEQSRSSPAPMDGPLQDLMVAAARGLAVEPLRLASGAGHDAAHMATIAPAAMAFIPCRGGVSHAPEEHAELEDITTGAQVLFDTLMLLARKFDERGS